jgi:hypothetical protein
VSIAERWRNLSDIEARDAIQKAAERGRGDGSWSTSQPIYVIKRVHGVWPSTPDVAWLLASAVAGRPNITEGDEALFRFVGWLEKTGVDLQGERSGWSSESREEDLIDLWATAVSINALVEIREIIEYRLWQLCEERFLVRRGRDLRALDEIDPVDLGAIHAQRLHRRLMVMARETAQEHVQSLKPAEPPEYAFVLHGPPGSSKTAIAEALGSEMWRSQKASRFVRITPADFTRGGEVRLDREARFIFDLLTHVRGVTIFFDEIDDLLRQRAFGAEPHFIKLLVPAMLNRLQDLRDAAPRQEICFLLATNYIDNIEPALTRPGRIDAAIPVPYPDAWSREAILENKLGKRSIDDAVKNAIVERTAGWPWSTYKRLCDKIAAMKTVDWDEVSAQIEHLATAFESSDFYYFVPKRWASGSHPLMHEFIRVSFSFSKDRNTNRRKVDDLVSLLEKSPDVNLARLPFASAFDAEWRRTRGQ